MNFSQVSSINYLISSIKNRASGIGYPVTSIKHQESSYLRAYKAPSTTVESALQNHPFLTNKANFRKSQMTVTDDITVDYEKRTLGERGKNKANSKPIQTQSKPIKANKMQKQTQFKSNQSQFQKGVPDQSYGKIAATFR